MVKLNTIYKTKYKSWLKSNVQKNFENVFWFTEVLRGKIIISFYDNKDTFKKKL